MIIKTFTELNKFLEEFNATVFALDIETLENNRVGIISLCDGATSCAILYPTLSMVSILKQKLIQPGNTIVGHNLVFDLYGLDQLGMDFECLDWFDTMIAAHLINENKDYPKGLKALINKHFPDRETMTYEEAIKFGFESEIFLKYAENDTVFTYDLMELQVKELQKQGLKKLFVEIEMPFLRAMLEMRRNGVRVDMVKANTISKELKNAIVDLQTQMYESLGIKYSMQTNLFSSDMIVTSSVDFNSPLQVRSILQDKLGLDLTHKTKSGALSVNSTVIEQFKHTVPFVAMLDKFRVASKLQNAFFKPLPEFLNNGKIYPNWNGIGTVTGRLSCSKPNMQQLPKINDDFPVETRSCFIPESGKKYIGLDYNQQELRIIAHLSQDKRLIDILLNGGDLHLINANLVFNLGIPDEKLYTSHPEYKAVKEQYANDRDKGKIFSFGIAYGMGPHKLSRDFKVSLEEAQVLLDNFFKGFPDLKKAIEETHKQAELKQEVISLTGRKRRFEMNQWGKVDGKALRQSFNFLIQSLGADIMRLACIETMKYKQMYPAKGINLVMTIHDELVIEVNESYAEEVKKDLTKLMEGVFPLVTPLKVGAKIGNNFGELK